jgi:hypothetical protein
MKKKQAANVDVVEDSEDMADVSLSSGDHDDAAIFTKPLTVNLLLERRKELCPTLVSMLRESLLPSFSFSANKLALGLTLLRALDLQLKRLLRARVNMIDSSFNPVTPPSSKLLIRKRRAPEILQ